MKLFKDNKELAGYFDILKWIVTNYPTDIFVMENPEFLEIRDRARKLLISKNKPNQLLLPKVEEKVPTSISQSTNEDEIENLVNEDYDEKTPTEEYNEKF